MNFTKLGAATWSEPGNKADVPDAIATFIRDMEETKMKSSLQFSNKTRSSRAFLVEQASTKKLTQNTSTQCLPAVRNPLSQNISSAKRGETEVLKKRNNPPNPFRQPPPGVSYSIQERPPNRAEIEALDRELEERVKAVLYTDTTDLNAVESGDLYQPHKDAMLIIRDQMLHDFGLNTDSLMSEAWLEKLIKCECLRSVCDHVASVLNDMLSVSSTELGSVLRKLRFTYKQSFEQMHFSSRQLHGFYLDTRRALEDCSHQLSALRDELRSKDDQMRMIVESEVEKVRGEFESQRALDGDTIAQTEHQMEQMSETLR